MLKTKFFESDSIAKLELEVNSWLALHKEIAIQQSNLCAGPRYSFYLLYSTMESMVEELKELAAGVNSGEMVPPVEINPEIMKPDSIYNQ